MGSVFALESGMEKIIKRLSDGTVWTEDRKGHEVVFHRWMNETHRVFNIGEYTMHPETEMSFDDDGNIWFTCRGRLSNHFGYQIVDMAGALEFESATVYWGGDIDPFHGRAIPRFARKYWRFGGPLNSWVEVADPLARWKSQRFNWQIVGDIAWSPVITGEEGFLVQPYLMSPTRGIYRTENMLGLIGYEGELVDHGAGPVLIWGGREYPVGDEAKVAA